MCVLPHQLIKSNLHEADLILPLPPLPSSQVAVVNIGIYAIAIYPVYNAIQFISQREADGLNELPDSAEEPISPDEKSLAGSA